MSKERKICVVTGTRADYGLLFHLMKAIEDSDTLRLQVAVTGAHLCPEFGSTYKEVEKDFHIDAKVEMLQAGDTSVSVCKSTGIAMAAFSDAFESLRPDITVILGDRYEMLAAAFCSMIMGTPVAHIHGGEITEGAYDDAIRHSITKMSRLHFTATESYRQRVIQLGENPDTVYNVGGLGIENINRLKLMEKDELEASMGIKLKKRALLITFHPETLAETGAKEQYAELLAALDGLKDTTLVFTAANSDTDGRIINAMTEGYVAAHKDSAAFFISLGQTRYLSMMKYADAVVGNSSSGLLEAPSMKTATVNIGNRQAGRIKADSVIDSTCDRKSIRQAIEKALSPEFGKTLETVVNPYDGGNPSEKITDVLAAADLSSLRIKKFYDINQQDKK